jgi:hypothetical protein
MKQIPLWRQTGGCRRLPETMTFAIVAYALVDDWWYDYLMQWRWSYKKDYWGEYARRHETVIVNGRRTCITISMQEVICGYKNADHIDRNGLNNQEHNLRRATKSEQVMNQGLNSDSTSGRKGVSWHRGVQKWCAYIRKDGVLIHLGYFVDKLDAAHAYDAKAIELFGDRAATNKSLGLL